MARQLSRDQKRQLDLLRMQFGRRLAEFRKRHALTQEKLAHNIGVDPVFVAYLESGARSPSFVTLYKLSRALNVTPAQLLA